MHVLVLLLLAGSVWAGTTAAGTTRAGGTTGADHAPVAVGELDVDDALVAEVTAYLDADRQELGIPGLAAVLVEDGEPVLEVGLGTTDGEGTPVTPQTPFLLASLSKSMTALAVVQLAQEGLVDLDAPVTDHLPELAAGGDEVTVADLMHHRAGLSTQVGLEPLVGTSGSSLDRAVARLEDDLHPAGFEYSNAGYDVLALLVERVAGTAYEDYLRGHVLAPLGMEATTSDPAVAAGAGLATGHDHWLLLGYRPHEPQVPDGMVGSYRTYSTAHDLGIYLDAQLGGAPAVVGEEALATLHAGEPVSDRSDYAGGLFVLAADPQRAAEDPLLARTVLIHDGSAVGYRSVLWMWPEEDVGLALLANANDQADEQQLVQTAFNVQRLLLGEPVVPHAPPTDPLYRWGKQGLGLLVLAQLVLAAALVRPVWRRLSGRGALRRAGPTLAAALAVDLVAVVVTVLVLPRALSTPFRVILTAPDMRVMILTALAVAALGVLAAAAWAWASRGGAGPAVRPG